MRCAVTAERFAARIFRTKEWRAWRRAPGLTAARIGLTAALLFCVSQVAGWGLMAFKSGRDPFKEGPLALMFFAAVGVLVVLFVVYGYANAIVSSLTVYPEGIEQHILFRTRFIPWESMQRANVLWHGEWPVLTIGYAKRFELFVDSRGWTDARHSADSVLLALANAGIAGRQFVMTRARVVLRNTAAAFVLAALAWALLARPDPVQAPMFILAGIALTTAAIGVMTAAYTPPRRGAQKVELLQQSVQNGLLGSVALSWIVGASGHIELFLSWVLAGTVASALAGALAGEVLGWAGTRAARRAALGQGA